MTSPNLLTTVAAVCTILSLVVSIFVVLRDIRRKAKEGANKEILAERLGNIAINLRMANTNLQILIRRVLS